MGQQVVKFEGPITPLTFGCCSPFRLGTWVNPEVTPQVFSSNGLPLRLAPDAVARIQAAYKGTPLKVKVGYPCCHNCCTCKDCCSSCCCLCRCCSCCNCPFPLYHDFAAYTELWFGRQNSDHMCPSESGACMANLIFCHIPNMCSKLCVDSAWVLPETVQLDTNQPLFTYQLELGGPPLVQEMCTDFSHLKPSQPFTAGPPPQFVGTAQVYPQMQGNVYPQLR